MKRNSSTFVRPLLWALLVLLLISAATFIIAYQQRDFKNKEDREELFRELSLVKGKFRSILYSDIASANAMGIIYKEYGTPKNFDSIAAQIIRNNKYAEVLQLTVDGVITHVYPIKGFENTIGINTLSDSTRIKEAKRATEKKEVFFAGPRKLRMGGVGILGKVPIVINNKSNALCVVLTRMETIGSALDAELNQARKFSCELIKKTPGTDTSQYFLTASLPSDLSPVVYDNIPEGDWQLKLSFSDNYKRNPLPPVTCVLGLSLALLASAFTFRSAYGSLSRFKAAFEGLAVGMVIVSPQGKFLKVNKAFCNMLGYSQEELLGLTFSAITHPDDQQTGLSFVKNANEGKEETLNIEKRYLHKNGSVIWVSIHSSVVHDEYGKLKFFVTQVENTTEKKKISQQLQESDMKFRHLVEGSQVGVYIIQNGHFVYVNPRMMEVSGYTEEELLSTPFIDFAHSDDHEKIIKQAKLRLSGEQTSGRYEARIKKKNGEFMWLEMFGNSTTYQGAPAIIGTLINITERKLMEEERKKVIHDLTLLNKEKEETQYHLNERVKELSTIYQINTLLQNENSPIDEICNKLVNILPEGWQHPDICGVKMEFNGNEYLTKNYRASEASQKAKIETQDGKSGFIEVIYTNETKAEYEGPFLKEERELLNNIAEMFVLHYNKRVAYNELKKSEANLKSIFDNTEVSFLLLDLKYNVVSFNQRFQKEYKERTGRWLNIGENFIESLLPDRKLPVREILDKVAQIKEPFSYDTTYTNKAEPAHLTLTVSPVMNNDTLIGMCMVGVDVTNRKNMEIKIQQMLEDIRGLNKHLQVARENERAHISREIHDELGQRLTGLKIQVAMSGKRFQQKDETFKTDIQEINSMIDDTVVTVRRIATDLRPGILDDLGLVAALEWQTEEFEKKTGLKCEFNVEWKDVPFEKDIATAVFRIYQESLTNIMRYSEATEVVSSFKNDDAMIYLSVKDNGKGFDVKKVAEKKTLGLFGMKERAHVFGGLVTVDSTPGQGTTIFLSLPIAAKTI